MEKSITIYTDYRQLTNRVKMNILQYLKAKREKIKKDERRIIVLGFR
jgi:hypothetical protein